MRRLSRLLPATVRFQIAFSLLFLVGCNTYIPIRYELETDSVPFEVYRFPEKGGLLFETEGKSVNISVALLQSRALPDYITAISSFRPLPPPSEKKEKTEQVIPELFYVSIAITNRGSSPIPYHPARFLITNEITGETLRPVSHEDYRKNLYGLSNERLPYEWLFLPVRSELFLHPVPDWAIRAHYRRDTVSQLEQKKREQDEIKRVKRRTVTLIEPGVEMRQILLFPQLPGKCRCRLTLAESPGEVRQLPFPSIPFRIELRYGNYKKEKNEKSVIGIGGLADDSDRARLSQFLKKERESLFRLRVEMYRAHLKLHQKEPELYSGRGAIPTE